MCGRGNLTGRLRPPLLCYGLEEFVDSCPSVTRGPPRSTGSIRRSERRDPPRRLTLVTYVAALQERSCIAFFQQSFQFRNRFEVLGTASSAFELDQFLQLYASKWLAEQFKLVSRWQQSLERTATGNFTKQVNRTQIRRQREVESRANCLSVKPKRQSGRCPLR